ncbi:hypothetical protein BaRGS_00027032 [Batillaria attramentaria]|uniref:Large ribosomal subunit protein uL3m n=1 Tax=Batillaria attramentaria TaxID=370345 RepID=A0ABD0K342_9CAEN
MAAKSTTAVRTLVAQIHCRLTLSSCRQTAYTGVLCSYQQARWRKPYRSQYKLREEWHAKKWSHSIEDVGLTQENEQFVKQVIHDTFRQKDSPLRDEPWQRGEYHKNTRRCGVLALKIGVLPQWTQEGHKFYTTLLQVLDNHVIRYIPPEQYQNQSGWKPYWNKWGSVVVGALSCDPRNFKKSYNSLFEEAGVPPKRKLTRFLVTPDSAIQPVLCDDTVKLVDDSPILCDDTFKLVDESLHNIVCDDTAKLVDDSLYCVMTHSSWLRSPCSTVCDDTFKLVEESL